MNRNGGYDNPGFYFEMAALAIKSLVRLARFYKWAFGDLTASDSDIGVIGEFLVGDTLGCLPDERKTQAAFDLVTDKGVSIEVKATTTAVSRVTKGPIYRWYVSDQRTALEGKRPLADVWVFLAAKFPTSKQRGLEVVSQLSVFEQRYWTCWVVPGEIVRSSGCREKISEATFERLGVEGRPFAEFKAAFKKVAV